MGKKKIDFNLYLITDRKLVTRHLSLVTAVRQALKGGVIAIQVREKDMKTRQLLKLSYRMRELTEKFQAKLFINDRFDIALAVGADGVHLAQSSIPVHVVRKTVKNRLLLGVSTHSLKEAKEAEKAGADFITLGPVYQTPSKMQYGKPVGLETLKRVCRTINTPVFAIGGIRSSRINEIKNAGSYGDAMISEICKANNIKNKTSEILMKMEESER
ncbi:thiamine phosphate synthase [bacterium]|nr:MAG: thiamine phosphate synthase [bacterium]